MNRAEIIERLEEAARTLKRVPNPPNSAPAGYRGYWPEIVRQWHDAWTATMGRLEDSEWHDDVADEPELTPPKPTPSEISRMDEALGWLMLIDGEDKWRGVRDSEETAADRRLIVWLKATGISWRRLSKIDKKGRGRHALQIIHARAIEKLRRKLS